MSEELIFDNLEDWKIEQRYFDENDFAGLVKYREKVAKKNNDDFYVKWNLCEAYILNKEYEKAMEQLTPLHMEEPRDDNVHALILDALFALGKNENDFKWKVKPIIVELNKSVINLCYRKLKEERAETTVHNLYCSLMIEGYLKFDENNLYEALSKDDRFEIEKEATLELSLVKILK